MRLVTIAAPASGGTVAAVEVSSERRVIKNSKGQTYRDVGELLTDPNWAKNAENAKEALPANLPLVRPILEPGAIVCVGLNYKNHILEMGRPLPEVPTLFSKNTRALTNPEAKIPLPAASQMVDYEAELVIVIGTGGRDIPKDKALNAVAGYTLMNDVSMRDFQKRSLQWFAGKSWENSTPIGPVVVTPDELPDFGKREIMSRVNGQQRQRSPLSDLLFDVPTLVSDLSRVFTLRPGDIIATGTPGGVGDAMKPPSYLKNGDVVEIEIQGIGILRNTFVGKA